MPYRATKDTAAAKEKQEVGSAVAEDARLQMEAASEAFKRLHQEGQALGAKWEDSMTASQRQVPCISSSMSPVHGMALYPCLRKASVAL